MPFKLYKLSGRAPNFIRDNVYCVEPFISHFETFYEVDGNNKIEAASGRGVTLENELTTLVHDIQANSEYSGLLQTELYKHVVVPGYFALHLFWRTERPQCEGSVLGLRLAHFLKIFGIVEHSVWLGK